MTNTPTPNFKTHAERLAYYSQAKDGAPVMPAQVNRPAPRRRRTSVKHRAIR